MSKSSYSHTGEGIWVENHDKNVKSSARNVANSAWQYRRNEIFAAHVLVTSRSFAVSGAIECVIKSLKRPVYVPTVRPSWLARRQSAHGAAKFVSSSIRTKGCAKSAIKPYAGFSGTGAGQIEL